MTTVDLPFPELAPLAPPAVWTMLPGTGLLRYDCTMRGITERCHGKCCHGPGGWPPRTGGPERDYACPILADDGTGCTLKERRPITCHLYPLRLNAQGTLVVHGATRFPHLCQGNRGLADAPLLIDALHDTLVYLFGDEQYTAARATLLAGDRATFVPPPWLLHALAVEGDWEAADLVPVGRTVHDGEVSYDPRG